MGAGWLVLSSGAEVISELFAIVGEDLGGSERSRVDQALEDLRIP